MEYPQLKEMPEALLRWYARSGRNLPWRKDKNPYHIWISEIMLQQTRVETVIEYYIRFIRTLPDVSALANASDERLLKLWEGLGYYSRARNLARAARQIISEYGGALPASYEELLTLPGIGPYTAGAIASIAFDLPVPAVDGNVLRVMSRILASELDISKKPAADRIRYQLCAWIPPSAPGDFNQALMELGATVCIPNAAPRCDICPIAFLCIAFSQGNPERYPVKSPKAPRKIEEKTVFILEFEGKYLLRKRAAKGLLAGMWEFPSTPEALTHQDVPQALSERGVSVCAIVDEVCAKHIFTHREWHMTGFFVKVQEVPDWGKGSLWASLEEIEQQLTIPTAFRAFLDRIRENEMHKDS